VKLKCDYYANKYIFFGITRGVKKPRMRKLITRGVKQATRTRTTPGQECGNNTYIK
jgi:hypothetical protein